MLLDLAIAISCGGGGVVCGWIVHALGGFGNPGVVREAVETVGRTEPVADTTREHVSEVADRLKAYALNMAADVDEHQSTVQAVNNSLLEGEESSPEVVLAAVSQLIEANEKMQTQLREAQDRIHEQTVQIETAEKRAQTDALTRVPNRGAFDAHIQARHARGASDAGTLALLDVDHFKKFNDVYGHRAGDEVLRVVAQMLHARLQRHGIVARFGGEEFAVILDGCSVQQASQYVEAARREISERDIEFENKRLRVTASMGVAELTEGESIDQWLQRADDALYGSKEAGRNCAHWMDENRPVKIQLTNDASSRRPASGASAATTQSQGSDTKDGFGEAKALAENTGSVPSAQEKPGPPHKPNALSYLPDRDALESEFDEIRGRINDDVPLFVMAVRWHVSPDPSSMRSLLQIVRATMRAVDRLGCEDNRTVLICMPSVNAATALQRGQQICRSASAIGGKSTASSSRQITVGVAEAAPQEKFPEIVSRVINVADQCLGEDTDCICLESDRLGV